MSKTVKNMIDAINQGNYSVAQSEFKSAIAQKVSTTFENKKIDIASRMTEGTQIDERKSRQMVDPDKEMLVVKNDKVKTIDKKDWDKYKKQGYQVAEDKEKKITESSSLPSRLVNQYERRADAERRAGGSIEIDYRLPYIAIEMSDGSEYFFQEYEADNLLDTVPNNINAEDFLLASAQNW